MSFPGLLILSPYKLARGQYACGAAFFKDR